MMDESEAREKLSTELHSYAGRIENGVVRNMIPGICKTCKAGIVMRRARSNAYRVYCHQLSSAVETDIAECTGYMDRSEMPLHAMVDSAQLIDLHRKTVGIQTNGGHR